jgi:hypothetical protein
MELWSHSREELFEVMRVVSKTNANVIVELGVYKMDLTVYFLSLLRGDKPLVIGLDIKDWVPEKRELMQKNFARTFRFILGKSTESVDKVKALIPDRKIDILFIDTEHDASSVAHDTLAYENLMNPEGYIIWHDARKIWEPHRTNVPGTATYPWYIRRLTERYPITLHFLEGSVIAYIKAQEWFDGKILWEKTLADQRNRGRKK